jgi:hypothetical protein
VWSPVKSNQGKSEVGRSDPHLQTSLLPWFDMTGDHTYQFHFYPGLTWLVITLTNFTFILVWHDWCSHQLTSLLPWFDPTGDHTYQLHFYPGLTWLVITPTNFTFILVWPDWWSHLPTSLLPWFDLTSDHTYKLHFYPGLTWSCQTRIQVKLVGVITSQVKPG